MYNISRVIRNC